MSLTGYLPTNWQDRSVSRPRTYTSVTNGDLSITLTPSEGTINNPGTPQNAAAFNNMETGISNVTNEVIAHEADYVRQIGFGNTGGTATAYTLTLSPAPTSYVNGMCITIIPQIASGINPTINVNGLGAKSLVKRNGSAINAGDLYQYSPYTFVYNGTNFVEVSSKDYTLDYIRTPGYGITTGGTTAYILTLSPAPSSYSDGMGIAINMNAANTGASTINVNGLGAKALKDPNGNDLVSGNLKLNTIYSFKYSSAAGNFILQGKGGGGNATAAQLAAGATATVDSGPIVGTAIIAPLPGSGSYVVFSENKYGSWQTQTPTELKRITMSIAGTFSFKFDLFPGQVNAQTVYAQIYKNGVAQGSALSTTMSYSQTFGSIDLTVNIGDTISVYVWMGSAGSSWAGNSFLSVCCASNPYATITV